MKIKHSLLAATLALSGLAIAQDNYPSKAITLTVPNPPGGVVDTSARLLNEPLARVIGQPVVIDNKAGGSGNVAYGAVARAKPDGYNLLISYSAYHVGNPALTPSLPWEAKDFAPVALLTVATNVIAAHPSVPANNLKEFIAYLKANPGKVNYASSGSGTSIHLSGEMFKSMAKVDMMHVPYKGSAPAVTDLLGNQIAIMFDNMPSVIPHVRSGKLRAIAITTAKRSPELPDVPTIAEAGVPGYEAMSWFGLLAPAATPAPVLAKLSGALAKVLANPEVKKKIVDQGGEPVNETPAQFAAFIQSESVKWGKVVKSSGASLD